MHVSDEEIEDELGGYDEETHGQLLASGGRFAYIR